MRDNGTTASFCREGKYGGLMEGAKALLPVFGEEKKRSPSIGSLPLPVSSLLIDF